MNVSLRQDSPAAAGLAYWIGHYPVSEFYRPEWCFRDVATAFYVGLTTYIGHPHRSFDEALPRMEARYVQLRNGSPLDWNDAMPLARAAWDRARARYR